MIPNSAQKSMLASSTTVGEVAEVRTHEKTGKNVAQHNGLLQPLEQHGGNARHHENQTEVGNHARFAV